MKILLFFLLYVATAYGTPLGIGSIRSLTSGIPRKASNPSGALTKLSVASASRTAKIPSYSDVANPPVTVEDAADILPQNNVSQLGELANIFGGTDTLSIDSLAGSETESACNLIAAPIQLLLNFVARGLKRFSPIIAPIIESLVPLATPSANSLVPVIRSFLKEVRLILSPLIQPLLPSLLPIYLQLLPVFMKAVPEAVPGLLGLLTELPEASSCDLPVAV